MPPEDSVQEVLASATAEFRKLNRPERKWRQITPEEPLEIHSMPGPLPRREDLSEIGAGTDGIVYPRDNENLGEITKLLKEYEVRYRVVGTDFARATTFTLVEKPDLTTSVKLK